MISLPPRLTLAATLLPYATLVRSNMAVRLADDDAEGMLSGRRQTVAVLFVDIRGFTSMGETMTPDELSAFLAEYRSRLTEPVFSHDGTVDKFIDRKSNSLNSSN